MMGLSDGRKSFPIGLAVLIQYRSMTASQPDSHPASQPRRVAITLNAKASSLTSSADADNRLDAFSDQSRSTNMEPFHMLHIVSYCVFTIFVFKKFHDLEMGVKGHSRSLRVVSFDRLCMVSY